MIASLVTSVKGYSFALVRALEFIPSLLSDSIKGAKDAIIQAICTCIICNGDGMTQRPL